jgi:hypothetical protein
VEAKLAHLQMIQSVIQRLTNQSFLIKGWTITVVAAVFALATKDAVSEFAYVAVLPVLAFWVMDALFLSLERQYRSLYDQVRTATDADIDFSMDVSRFATGRGTLRSAAVSGTVLGFHGVVLVAVALGIYLLPRT